MSVNIKDSSLPAGYRPIAGMGTSDIRKYTTAEWDALTEDQLAAIPEGALVHITDDGVSNICGTVADCITSDNPDDVAGASALNELNNKINQLGITYSTNEEKTNDTWIDGKPIYRKVISNSTPSSSGTSKTFSANVSGASLVSIDYAHSYAKSGDTYIPFTEWFGSSGLGVIAHINSGAINLEVWLGNGGWTDLPLFVTIEYTK